MKTVEGKYASALVYSDSVEDYALAQIKLLSDDMSFKGSRIRVMPDVHPGKVGPVGFTATMPMPTAKSYWRVTVPSKTIWRTTCS